MKVRRSSGWVLCFCLTLSATECAFAGDPNPPPPTLYPPVSTNGQQRISWSPYPAAQEYKLLSGTNALAPLTEDNSGTISGYDWTGPSSEANFQRLRATTISSNALFAATVLNRLIYGPTPDDIEHMNAIGPQAFINEQLAWENIAEDLDNDPPIVNTPITVPPPPPLTNWIRVSATGTANGVNFGIYLSGAGSVYLDDVRLVYGTNADSGANLLLNGDFEDPTLTNGWNIGSSISASRTMITNSPTVDGNAASGTNCLLLVATSSGSGGLTTGLWTPYTNATPSGTTKFTLSFSYLPVRQTSSNITLTVRMSGSLTIANVNLPNPPPTPPTPPKPPVPISPIYAKLTNCAPPLPGYSLPPTNVSLNDLRAYHVLHAIQSKRQLYEILVQFFDNHFTTEWQKTKDWIDNNWGNSITNDATRQNLAVDLDWREHNKWRQALLNPNCTFYDLLKISIESPMMIIYLDTVLSTRSAPNENYAREILELHTMGVDNGYVQQDIVELARVWTGWSVARKDPAFANDPFAAPLTDATNNPGVFVLHFKPTIHTTNQTKRLFTNVVVDPRFGPFRGGQPYGTNIAINQFPGTNGMAEGYNIAQYLANLPQTMEFISVKLCRTFVHENFDIGIYDYGSPSSAEAQLIKDCMTAWDTPAGDGRKGNIRSVLSAIFSSDLFRGHAASRQKIKTPLEFAVSAVRALRFTTQETNNWVGVTSDSDGYGLVASSGPLFYMGGMNLFAKPEPDGWSEFGRIWLNTANLCERMRFVQHLCMPSSSSLKSKDYGTTQSVSDPVKLLKQKLPAASWNDAGAIVDYFLDILCPGEGKANLDLDRTAAIAFLNTNDAGAASPFPGLANATADGRVRGMVGMLMSFPRFQEQ